MLLYLLLGGIGYIALKKSQNAANTSGTHTTSGARNVAGTSSIPVPVAPPGRQGPSSFLPKSNNVNANQPWYTGAAIAGGGLALAQVAKGLASLKTQSDPTGTPDAPDIEDSDLEGASQEMSASSYAATDESESPGDFVEDDGGEESA